MKKKTIYKSDLYHGDALEVLPTLNTEFDAAIVDPPYSTAFVGKFYDVLKKYQEKASLNKKRECNAWAWGGLPGYWSDQFYKSSPEFEQFTEAWMKEIFRLLKPGSFFACFGTNKLIHVNVRLAEKVGFQNRDLLIWRFSPTFNKGFSLKRIDGKSESKRFSTALAASYEPIMLFQKPFSGTNKDNFSQHQTGFLDTEILPSNIIEINKPDKREKLDNPHYCIKPLKLMEVLCRGLRANKIIDPFMGSGPLALASIKLRCEYVGIELESDFFDYAVDKAQKIFITNTYV